MQNKIQQLHKEQSFSLAIDLTDGNVSQLIQLDDSIETINDFHVSRVRDVTKPDLPTTGHLISHTVNELSELLESKDMSNVLLLDDTSFSGTTTMQVEKLVRQIVGNGGRFTHGFLILNNGELGTSPGAKRAIQSIGGRAVGGIEMHTPDDDGWHFFDIVKQTNIDDHLLALRGLLRVAGTSDFENRAAQMLRDPDTIETLFPHRIPTDQLRDKQKQGKFLARGAITGTFHSTNPQLLPNIIQQGHITPPDRWKMGEIETLASLVRLHKLVMKGEE